MNGAQMLLTIGGVALFGLATLGIYGGIQSHQQTLIENDVFSQALLQAQRFIEEARARSFDEVCNTQSITAPASLTSPDSLGPERGESYPAFDDVDDFNKFTQTWTENSIDFRVSIVVSYLDGTLPNSLSDVNHRTWKKHFTVTITSSYLKHSVVLNHIFAYYG